MNFQAQLLKSVLEIAKGHVLNASLYVIALFMSVVELLEEFRSRLLRIVTPVHEDAETKERRERSFGKGDYLRHERSGVGDGIHVLLGAVVRIGLLSSHHR